jgi:phosphoglycolate phosphatase-like HAD superfamily hydrolase
LSQEADVTLLQFSSVSFDTGLIVLDKDGTLLDFEMWNILAAAWVDRLAEGFQGDALRDDLCRNMGFDYERRYSDPQGPMAIATTAQIMAIAAGTLYRHGLPWPQAEDRARLAFDTEAEIPLASLMRPAGNLPPLFRALKAAGVPVAVVTTDHRRETEVALQYLGIAGLVDYVLCGDDGVPPKPAPDMLLVTCRQMGVEPGRVAMVGDTLGDLIMAERAGAGLRVGVLTGAGTREELAPHADVVLDSVDDIRVAAV